MSSEDRVESALDGVISTNQAVPRKPKESLHLSLARELRRRIEAGEWEANSRVPSVRQLAKMMDVSTVTVARAYQSLSAAGLLSSAQGSGTFVSPGVSVRQAGSRWDTSWQQAILSRSVPTRTRSVALPGIHPPNTISLATGGTATDAIPIEWFHDELRKLLPTLSHSDYRYSPAIGYPQFREWTAGHLERTGIKTIPDNVLVTSGAQQAIFLAAQILINQGDIVIVERPTYTHGLAVFEALGATCIEVNVGDYGLDVDQAAELMARFRPKLLFTVPTGHNPTGTTMPIEERRRLVEFARRYGVAILEDDVWSEFSYDAPAPPAIKSFDTDGHVVYVRSFSKLFEPSLRLAAVVAEGPLFAAMVEAKGYVDRFTSTFMQRAFLAYATSNRFHRGLRMARDTYRTRRDAMLHALGNEMPTDVTWNPPAANCNVWVKLPAYLPASEVARQAALKGVLVAQGESYYYRDPPNDRLRVTFSDNPIDVMEEGVRRLGAAVREIAYDPLRTAHLANWS